MLYLLPDKERFIHLSTLLRLPLCLIEVLGTGIPSSRNLLEYLHDPRAAYLFTLETMRLSAGPGYAGKL